MRKPLSIIFLGLFCIGCCFAAPRGGVPRLGGTDSLIVSAYDLAVSTVFMNINKKGIIKAGREYGGEWTRDISINTRNACNTICPEEAVYSLWKVTENGGEYVGHQYWDKIIWVPAAYEQCLVMGDDSLWVKTYRCAANTMAQLEESVFDKRYGLFNGGSVFNDGISAYEEPVYDPSNGSGGIIDHPCNLHICCLSTNCLYYQAYRTLAALASRFSDNAAAERYEAQAGSLKSSIRKYFWNPDDHSLNYMIDQEGGVHRFQEGLGYAFAILCDILTPEESFEVTRNVHVSEYGIPSIWPDFKRFSAEKPGRHNNLVWPHVNTFYAEAALKAGNREQFIFELRNLADLAVNKSGGHFYEIYNPQTGLPDGGWQKGGNLNSSKDQTWCATGFLSLVFKGLWGLDYTEEGLVVAPDKELLGRNGVTSLKGLEYRGCTVDVSLERSFFKKGLYVNGRRCKNGSVLITPGTEGKVAVELYK